jgi:VIT1/CCC1 family predicted Fe2+/Mn2+ transporter
MDFDALGAHARDELGINEVLKARPLQAALVPAASFTVGAAIPLLAVVVVTNPRLMAPCIAGVSLVLLALPGGIAEQVGGARVTLGAIRVLLWGRLGDGPHGRHRFALRSARLNAHKDTLLSMRS